MAIYRVYTMTREGHSERSPQVVECEDHHAAVRLARQYLDGKPVEIWDDARRIARLEPEP